MKLYFDDAEFDQQLQRTFAKASSRMCDVGEVFAIANRIQPGKLDSWHDEWFAAGESNRRLADASELAGASRDAGDAYLRASECYRSAYFFCRRDPHGAQLLESFRLSREMFRKSLPHPPVEAEVVEIPYENGVAIPAFILWGVGDRSGPTALMPSGYDSPIEESNDAFWSVNQGVNKQEYWLSRFKAHNLDQPLDYVREMKRWVVDVEAIACPTYVSYGEGDYAEATSKDFYDRLTVAKHFEMFKDADGSGGHCEGMGQSRYYAGVFGFINEHLAS